MKKFLSWLRSPSKSKKALGIVEFKHYYPTTTGTSYDRKLKKDQIKVVPESYLLTIEMKGTLRTIEVEKEIFLSKSKGDKILVEYTIGRKGLCVKKVIG